MLLLSGRGITKRENPSHQSYDDPGLIGRGVWPEDAVFSGIIRKLGFANHENARELFFRYEDVEGGFIVFEAPIEFRLMGADELGFGDDSVKITLNRCPFQSLRLGKQQFCFRLVTMMTVIRLETTAKITRFADVENLFF